MFGSLIILITSILLTGCQTIRVYWPPIVGVVLDEETNKPLEGVYVVALWEGDSAYNTSICFRSKITVTDSNGEYMFPEWRNESGYKTLSEQYMYATFYKSGYSFSRKGTKDRDIYSRRMPFPGYYFSDKETKDEKVYNFVKYFHGPREERLNYLNSFLTHCGKDYPVEDVLELLRAIYTEADELLVNSARPNANERSIMKSMQYNIARISVAPYWSGGVRTEVRIDDFIRNNFKCPIIYTDFVTLQAEPRECLWGKGSKRGQRE